MTLDYLLATIFSLGGFFRLLGALLIIVELLYIVYSFIIVHQVSLLNKSFNTGFALIFVFLAYVHLIFSLLIFLLSFTIFI